MKKVIFTLVIIACSILLKAQTTDSVTNKFNKIPYVRTDTFSKFPGGNFDAYIEQNAIYPGDQKQDIDGEIVVVYSIDVNGSVVNARLLKNLSPAVDNEILRVFNSSPKWKPATYHGNNVAVNIGARLMVKVNVANKTIEVSPKKPSQLPQTRDDNTVYMAVQKLPGYPGGTNEFTKYLNENIVYPKSALDNNIDGKVIIELIVERDGSLSTFRAVKSPHEALTNESIRVLGLCKFNPGMQNGKAVRVKWMILINYDHKNPNDHSAK